MAYFDPTKSTKVLVDASPTVLGDILMQDGKIISYGSRALTDFESRYFQTQRECSQSCGQLDIIIFIYMVRSSR
jgi:hypothetical protein